MKLLFKMENKKKARVIAFYLPQFHPIPENDKWWGKGFTEWTNVGKAKPLFRGHNQPRVPADLGYYDLRMPEIRELQAEMAHEAGIEGFMYWHYWFGNGKQLLERPFNEVLESGKPNFPFCLGWANHDWTTKSWESGKNHIKQEVIQKQLYPGEEDYTNHFYHLLKAFKDTRYIKVDNKPLFLIFDPFHMEDPKTFFSVWTKLAVNNGFNGFHFVGITDNNVSYKKDGLKFLFEKSNEIAAKRYRQILDMGFDAVNSRGYYRTQMLSNGIFKGYVKSKFKKLLGIGIDKYKYKDIINNIFIEEDKWENVYPSIIPNYDRSPRSGKKAVIWYGSTPQLFKKHVEDALKVVVNKSEDNKIIFLKSWNEWGETNYIEPDVTHGKSYLDSLKECLLTD